MSEHMTIRSLAKIVEELEIRLKENETIIQDLSEKVVSLEDQLSPKTPTIQRVEGFNGEVAPEPKNNLKMNDEDKMFSIKNAIAILPPNLVDKNQRHTKENIAALCGFKVSEEQVIRAYGASK